MIKWDPAKNVFAGGTGDASWLTREYRDPWKVWMLASRRVVMNSAVRPWLVVAILLWQLALAGAQDSETEANAETSRDVKIALLRQAETAADKIGDADGAASAYWSIGALFSDEGTKTDAVKVLEKARVKALAVKDRMRRWELVELVSREETRAGAAIDPNLYLPAAENNAQKSAVVSSLAAGYFEGGNRVKSAKLFEQAWKLAQEVEGPYKEVFFLSLADDASSAGDKVTAREFYTRFRAYVQMLGGEAELLGLRKLAEAQLEAGFKRGCSEDISGIGGNCR